MTLYDLVAKLAELNRLDVGELIDHLWIGLKHHDVERSIHQQNLRQVNLRSGALLASHGIG